MISKLCQVEMRELQIAAKEHDRRGEHAKAVGLRKKAEQLGLAGFSTDELIRRHTEALIEETGGGKLTQASPEYRAAFCNYLRTGEWSERRDVQVGTQTLTYSQLAAGTVLIPIETEKEITEALAAVDPLMSDSVVDFKMSDTPFKLRSINLREMDLSTIFAQNIAETVQQTPLAFTFAGAKLLRQNITYRYPLAASLEAEQDIEDFLEIYGRSAGVAFARTIGKDLAVGNGSTNTPAGLFPFLGPSVYATGSGKIILADINAIFGKVDPAYRAMPKCGWLCSDAVYQRLLNAVDGSGRPLLDVVDGSMRLRGKPIYISPSLSNAFSSEGFGALIFGDLSHFKVRVSKPWLQRSINQGANANGNSIPGDIDRGECLYITRMKADSAFLDPSNGGSAPIVWGSITT